MAVSEARGRWFYFCLVEVAKAMRVGPTQALVEYNSGVGNLLKKGAGLTADSSILRRMYNRARWSSLLNECRRLLLNQISRFYVSVLGGECQVKRDLGLTAAERGSHCNLSDQNVSDTLVLRSRGPHERTDWERQKKAGLTAETTEWAKDCVSLWRKVYGARVGSGGGIRPRNDKRRAFKGVHEKVIAAAAAVAKRQNAGMAIHGRRTVCEGLSRVDLSERIKRHPARHERNKEETTFEQATEKKKHTSRIRKSCLLQGRGLDIPNRKVKATLDPPRQRPLRLDAVKKVHFMGQWRSIEKVLFDVQVVATRASDANIFAVSDLKLLMQPSDEPLSVKGICFIVLNGLACRRQVIFG